MTIPNYEELIDPAMDERPDDRRHDGLGCGNKGQG